MENCSTQNYWIKWEEFYERTYKESKQKTDASEKMFCAGNEGGNVMVYKIIKGLPFPLLSLKHYPKKTILAVQFAPDGRSVYTSSNDGWIRRWNLMQ